MADGSSVAAREDDRASIPAEPRTARSPWTNLALFVCTVVSTFYVGAQLVENGGGPLRGWVFAVPLLAILVTHEMGP